MNTYQVLQLSDGTYKYTCENSGNIIAVGYCRPYRQWWLEDSSPPINQAHIAEYEATGHKHHEIGHATAEEAAACYREYLLDHRLNLLRESSNNKQRCAICGDWTNLSAEVNMERWSLCIIHNTREQVDQLFELNSSDVIWSSY